ncbi:MAG TPA: hypothetical protein VFG58_04725 [Solirubrobacterales bacterium]|nr:hypothetical protein [Solirubrobacterales bacterium]
MIACCWIGERSAHTRVVLHELLGAGDVKNYDGSWTEWGNLVGVPNREGGSLSERDSTGFEIVADLIRPENLDSPMSAWALEVVLACLDHLALKGEVSKIEGTDPQRWMSGSKPEVDQT